MATKRIGISRDLIIHPGETIADILEERGITQAELATRTGVSPRMLVVLSLGKRIFPQILRWPWNMLWMFRSPFG